MGQVSEDVINGICCQLCGQWMDDIFVKRVLDHKLYNSPPGYPRTCSDCKDDSKQKGEKNEN